MNIDESLKNKLNLFIQITLIGSFTLSTIYVWSFWRSFNLNIFAYLSLWDSVKFSLFALPALVMVCIAIMYASILSLYSTPNQYVIFISVWLAIFFLVDFFIIDNTSIMIFAIFLSYFLIIIYSCFKKIIQNPLKIILISVCLILPVSAFIKGKMDARNILKNGNYLYSNINNNYFKYLGYVNTHYFFISMDNKNLLITEDFKSLTLKQFHGNKIFNEPLDAALDPTRVKSKKF